jgi:hypothetical protein
MHTIFLVGRKETTLECELKVEGYEVGGRTYVVHHRVKAAGFV